MEKETVIIIGGGAAGLMASKELAGAYNIIILEASHRLGGRIWSKQTLAHSPVIKEAGAEFIHGHQKQTIQLLNDAGIQYVPVEGKLYRKENGEWKEQSEMVEGWNGLLTQMKKIKQDMSLQDFLVTCFSGNDQVALRRHAVDFAEGFDLADIKTVSVKSLYDEWSNEEEENFRIPAGYGALIHFLEDACEKKGCRILTNHTVKQIDWEKKCPGNPVMVYPVLSFSFVSAADPILQPFQFALPNYFFLFDTFYLRQVCIEHLLHPTIEWFAFDGHV